MGEGAVCAHWSLALPPEHSAKPIATEWPGSSRGNLAVSCHPQQKANPLHFWPHSSELKDSVQSDNTMSVSCNDRQHLLSLVSTLDPPKALILKLVLHPGVPQIQPNCLFCFYYPGRIYSWSIPMYPFWQAQSLYCLLCRHKFSIKCKKMKNCGDTLWRLSYFPQRDKWKLNRKRKFPLVS